jgi:hypothetical protein
MICREDPVLRGRGVRRIIPVRGTEPVIAHGVDESGKDVLPRRVNDRRAFRDGHVVADLGDAPAADEDVPLFAGAPPWSGSCRL